MFKAVHSQIAIGRLLNWNVGRLRTAQDFIDIVERVMLHSRQTATGQSSGAANPRVPVLDRPQEPRSDLGTGDAGVDPSVEPLDDRT